MPPIVSAIGRLNFLNTTLGPNTIKLVQLILRIYLRKISRHFKDQWHKLWGKSFIVFVLGWFFQNILL